MTGLAFTAMVSQYQALVYTVCYQLVRDADVAQDLAQEAFLSAWRSIDRCPAGFEKQWLTRIAVNKARDHLRSGWYRKVSAPGDEVLALSGAPPDQSPDALVVAADEAEALQALVLALREPYHTPAKLCFLQGMGADQAARACGRPLKTVQSQLYRARQMLKAQLAERSAQDEAKLR